MIFVSSMWTKYKDLYFCVVQHINDKRAQRSVTDTVAATMFEEPVGSQ